MWSAAFLACALVSDGDLAARFDLDGDGVSRPVDCDDADPAVMTMTWFPDGDGDGYGAEESTTECDPGEGWTTGSGDCDDSDELAFPGAPERCNEFDDDCDGVADDGVAVPTWYLDADGDGYGTDGETVSGCVQPAGWAAVGGDCDDADHDLNPEFPWHPDADIDGYGSAALVIEACVQPEGSLVDGTDCDDARADVSPSGVEVCDSDDVDENCDGLADDEDPGVTGLTAWYADNDGDGVAGAFDVVYACDDYTGRLALADDCDDDDAGVTDEECRWVAVAAGSFATCGIWGDGSLACWASSWTGVDSPPAGTFVAVATGGNAACAISTDGSLSCWGVDSYGVGILSPPTGSFVAVDVQTYHACAVRDAGEVVCWGLNSSGEGDVPSGTFDDVTVGANLSCALSSGSLSCWGQATSTYEATMPAALTAFDAGAYTLCGIDGVGELRCTTTSSSTISSPPVGAFSTVSCSNQFSMCGALADDGSIAIWGDNYAENFVGAPSGAFGQVSLGQDHACAIDAEGGMQCWGACADPSACAPPEWGL